MKTIKHSMYLVALFAALTACKKNADEVTQTDYPRAFSPTDLTVQHTTFDKATVSWKTIENAINYEVELSRGDSNRFDNVIATWEVEGLSLNLTDLWGETRYSVRVKAKAFSQGQADSKWTDLSFRTPSEQIFKSVKDVEVKGTSVTVRWDIPDGTINKLNVNQGVGDIALTSAEVAANVYTITGLEPNTAYAISIWNGDQKRGEVNVTTQWKPTGSEANVVIVGLGQPLGDITSDPANIGKTIYLPDGYTADVADGGGFVIAGTMTIFGDPDAVNKPHLTTSATSGGNKLFGLTPTPAETIRFANLVLESTSGTNGIAVIHPGTNVVDDQLDIKELAFDNCDIRNFGRCFLRLQNTDENAKAIKKVSFNNCTAHDVGTGPGGGTPAGNYGFFTLNVNAGGIDTISVTNSTISMQWHSFVNAPQTSGYNPCKVVIIENSTFNDVITGEGSGSNRYFIDGNNNTAININIRNVILGQTGSTNASGYRYGTGGAITVSNTYTTSDWRVASSTNLPSVTSYSGASTVLFADPANGDFTIRDAGFAGRNSAGDPRWR